MQRLMHEIKHTAGHHVHADHRTRESQLPESILAPSEMGEKEFLKLTLFSARRGHFVREKINKKRKLCGRDKKRERIKLHRRGPSSPPTHSQAQPAKKNGGFRHRLNGATHNSRMLSTAV